MEYLQYFKGGLYVHSCYWIQVLNLIINGIPSIHNMG